MTAKLRRFIVCSVCLGWGRMDTYEPDEWHRTTGACPECNGTGGEVWIDEQAEAA